MRDIVSALQAIRWLTATGIALTLSVWQFASAMGDGGGADGAVAPIVERETQVLSVAAEAPSVPGCAEYGTNKPEDSVFQFEHLSISRQPLYPGESARLDARATGVNVEYIWSIVGRGALTPEGRTSQPFAVYEATEAGSVTVSAMVNDGSAWAYCRAPLRVEDRRP